MGAIYALLGCLGTIGLMLLLYALSFLVVAGLSYLVCLGFGFEWSWLIALGVWAGCMIVRWCFSAARNVDKEK